MTAGACTVRIRRIQVLKIAIILAVFQGLMPIVGWLLGSGFKNIVESFDHWIAFVLLFGIGGKMIFEGLKAKDSPEAGFNVSSSLVLMGVGLATSIDALVVGIGFGLLSVNIWLATLIIGLTTFVFSASGVLLGKKIGNRFNHGVIVFGGVILVLLGVKILYSHLM